MSIMFNVRGCNGSGKSTIAKKLIDENNGKEVWARDRIIGYECDNGLFVVGKYTSPCGGADSYTDVYEAWADAKDALNRGWHVLIEGVVLSGIYQSTLDVDREITAQGHQFHWCFLDTPLRECLRRISLRREKKGKDEVSLPSTTVLCDEMPEWPDLPRLSREARGAIVTDPVTGKSRFATWYHVENKFRATHNAFVRSVNDGCVVIRTNNEEIGSHILNTVKGLPSDTPPQRIAVGRPTMNDQRSVFDLFG